MGEPPLLGKLGRDCCKQIQARQRPYLVGLEFRATLQACLSPCKSAELVADREVATRLGISEQVEAQEEDQMSEI
jgi:hypothetical protein